MFSTTSKATVTREDFHLLAGHPSSKQRFDLANWKKELALILKPVTGIMKFKSLPTRDVSPCARPTCNHHFDTDKCIKTFALHLKLNSNSRLYVTLPAFSFGLRTSIG
jgi:hypothetical protein